MRHKARAPVGRAALVRLVGPLAVVLGATCALGAALTPSRGQAMPRQAHASEAERADTGRALFHRLVERERAPRRFLRDVARSPAGPLRADPQFSPHFTPQGSGPAVPRPPSHFIPTGTLDCEHARHDIALDPRTGTTSATLELSLRATGALGAIAFTIDAGLSILGVSATGGREATVNDGVFGPARVVRIDFSPPLATGDSTQLRVSYAGTLACGSYPSNAGFVCAKGRDFSYFAHQSIFPYLFDPAAPDDATFDGMTRDIILRVPAGTDVVATGEKIAESTSGDTTTSSWAIGRPLSRAIGVYVFAGKLGQILVPGRTVPTTLVFPTPETGMDQRLLAWSAPILGFVEGLGGGPLPFQKSLSLVRLPADVGDPGTATFGMTLLSESYARAGELMHEETWAHENSHLFWGIVVPETDSLESRLTTEGLATLSEIDYSHARHFANEDREAYLAKRFAPIGLDLRSTGVDLPPVVVPRGSAGPDALDAARYTQWAYEKTAATLDHLRATMGDEAFTAGLGAYVRQCSFVGCRVTEFRAALEKSSGEDLRPFFERWVTGSSRPTVTLAFSPLAGGAEITFDKADEQPMTLKVVIGLEDGRRVERWLHLADRTTRLRVETPAAVRSVATSARHDVMVDARSAVVGDLDFDGEVDGFDILRCATLVGTSYQQGAGLGLWNIDEAFDPRCDVDGNFRVDDADIGRLASAFGVLRVP